MRAGSGRLSAEADRNRLPGDRPLPSPCRLVGAHPSGVPHEFPHRPPCMRSLCPQGLTVPVRRTESGCPAGLLPMASPGHRQGVSGMQALDRAAASSCDPDAAAYNLSGCLCQEHAANTCTDGDMDSGSRRGAEAQSGGAMPRSCFANPSPRHAPMLDRQSGFAAIAVFSAPLRLCANPMCQRCVGAGRLALLVPVELGIF